MRDVSAPRDCQMRPRPGGRPDRDRGYSDSSVPRQHNCNDSGTFSGSQNGSKITRVGYAVEKQQWVRLAHDDLV
jgi:hypothetical protein